MEVIKYNLPEFWAVPLIYGDYSGLTDDDIASLELFIKDNKNVIDLICFEVGEDTNFLKYHDAKHYGVLACTCLEYFFREA